MSSSKTLEKREARDDYDDEQPLTKQSRFEGVDEVISSLHNMLQKERDNKNEFNANFARIIANKNQLKHRQIQWLNEPSSTGLNFLMLACKYGNANAVEILVSFGLNLNKKDIEGYTASDFAWQSKCSRCLSNLLQSDSPFPKKFDVESLESSDDKLLIIDFVLEIKSFHENIRQGDMKNVQTFIATHQNVRFAYDENNQSALTTALKSKQIKIYSFLCNNFYEAGVDSNNHIAYLNKLPDRIKKQLREQLRRHLNKPVDDHIMALLSKSRDRSGGKENFKKLYNFYQAINAVPQISLILQLVAKSENTDIVFDFNEEGVSGLDPTITSNPFGLTYDSMGYILIGAGREESEVLGTIAHELTHWALQVVYKNKCQPFFEGSNKGRELYEIIVEKYANFKRNDVRCNEIEEVFDIYDPADINKELIVRVPHLLAMHRGNPEKQKKISEAFQDLFNFFEENILPDVERELMLIEQKEEVKRLNKLFGISEKSLKMDMLSSLCKKEIDFDKCLFIKTTTPDLLLEYIVKNERNEKKKVDEDNIFVELEELFQSKELENVLDVFELSEFKPRLFVFNSQSNLVVKSADVKVLHKICNLNPILISSTQNACLQEFFKSETDVTFKWNDLNDQAKEKIRNFKILFQDHDECVRDIVEDEQLLEEIPLEKLLNPSLLKLKSLNNVLPIAPRVFMKRSFVLKTSEEFDDLCDFVSTRKTVLIADSAGMGKSTSAVQLARDLKLQNELSWVVFFDLKQHTSAFLQDHQIRLEDIRISFFYENLLKLETSFEKKLFESFYEDGKVIFIVDGFDEISPKYTNFVLIILRTITNSKNRLLVTTRLHLTEKLEKELLTEAIKLKPFDEEDQIDFLFKYWNQESKDNLLKSRVADLLKKCQGDWSADVFWKTPIHIFMIAEVFDNQDLVNIDELNTNIYQLYENFIRVKLRVWNQKGSQAEDESLILQQTVPATNFWQIFYRLALEQLFSDGQAEVLKIPEVPDNIIDEMIARVGIVAYNSKGSAQFIHRTYAEYFVADMIVKHAFKKDSKYEFVKLFGKVILAEDFGQIRTFLNDKLKLMDTFETKVLAKQFKKFARQEKNFLKLKDFASATLIVRMPSCSRLFSLIFETLNFDFKLKAKVLKFVLRNYGDQYDYFTTVWQCAQSNLDETKVKALMRKLLFTEVRGNNMLSMAISHELITEETGPKRVSQLLIEYSEEFLNEPDFLRFYYDEKNKNFSFSHILSTNDGSFEKIWAAAERKLSKNSLKKLMLGKDEWAGTILHSVARENVILIKWLKIIKDMLEPEELNEHLTTVCGRGHMFIRHMLFNKQLKIKEMKNLWDFMDQNIDPHIRKKLLCHESGKKGRIFIEKSIRNDDKSVVDFIFDITESILPSEEKNLIDLLRKRESLAEFILHIVICSNEYFDKYSSKLSAAELKIIFSKNTPSYDSLLHRFVKTKNPELSLFTRLVDQINDHEEIKRLLLIAAFRRYSNVFHILAENNNHFLLELLEWCKLNFEREFVEHIFVARDYGHTLLHKLAQKGDNFLITKCLEFVSNNFNVDEQRKMLLEEDKSGCLPIQMIFENKNQGVVENIATFYGEFFEKERLRNMLSRMKFKGTDLIFISYKRFSELKTSLEIQWKVKNAPK